MRQGVPVPNHPSPVEPATRSSPREAGVAELRTGLWSIELPIPPNPWHLRSARAYAIDTPGGLLMVDAGWDAPETLVALENGLSQLGAKLADVRGVLLTHMHPDHGGLAGRVREAGGAWVAMHAADHDALTRTTLGGARAESAWLEQCGVPQERREALERAGEDFRRQLTDTRADRVLQHGDRPLSRSSMQVLHTPGHTPGHACFHDPDRRVLFRGDHLMASTSPNVPHDAATRNDALGDYLRSLDRVLDVASDLVLPGHDQHFSAAAPRVDAAKRHHEARLVVLSERLSKGPATTWEVAPDLYTTTDFLALPPHAQRAALAEASAHLVHLWHRGQVRAMSDAPVRWSVPSQPRPGSEPALR